jgi:hypothetical protein
MPDMPINPLGATPYTVSLTTGPGPAATIPPQVNPLAQGDGLKVGQQGELPASLRQKLTGKIPGAISLESLTIPDVASLRATALQAKQPRAVTHDDALRVRRAALVQLQTGAQSGSAVSAIAGATAAILDGSAGVGTFRLTEFTDRVLDWIATTGDEQFAVTPGVSVADGMKAMVKGLLETRGADPTTDGPAFSAALAQAAQMAAPGSFVASLVKAHETLGRQVTSPRDQAQLAEQALNELTMVNAYDVLAGGTPKALRAVAKHANWMLTYTDAERISLKSAALRTIAGMSAPNSKVAYVANDSLRLAAAAGSVMEQDRTLKAALDLISTAQDAEF